MFKIKYLYKWIGGAILAVCVTAQHTHAEVARVELTRRTDLLNARAFGDIGAYELLEGRVFFTLDPLNSRNDIIVDLKLAPRNAQGLVEFSADVAMLRPRDAKRASGVVLFDVVNRGRHTVLEYLNRANRTAPTWSEAFVGDDFLFRQGVTLVWLGWQQDLPELPGYLRLSGPRAAGIPGRVYGEFSVASRVMDVSLGDRLSIPYPVADVNEPTRLLGVSPSRAVAPKAIPVEHWAFARIDKGARVADPLRVHVEDGFVPGAVYRFAYNTRDPQIAGLGLAGVRDLVAWLRHDAAAPMRATHAYAFGMSQSGRFLRQFLHEGFNQDLAGRPVFDAMMVHIAGGARRGFNERFAQPSRTTGSRVFPFTDLEQSDSETGEKGGLLDRARAAKVVPKIFYTHSSWEYWGSAASATHTTLAGGDIEIPATSRVYLLAGTQHEPVRMPFKERPDLRGQLPHNLLDYRPALRALYVALDQWSRHNVEPPASRYPKVAERSLVARAALNVKGWQGVNVPANPQPVFRLDNGEKEAGIPTLVPPRFGKPYALLVPQLDDDGNEIAGIRLPTLSVPLATYSGWNLRAPAIGAPHELVQLVGGMRAFARTREERAASDPRPVVTERYTSREAYLEQIAREATVLVKQRLLLNDDLSHVAADAARLWDIVMQAAPAKPAP